MKWNGVKFNAFYRLFGWGLVQVLVMGLFLGACDLVDGEKAPGSTEKDPLEEVLATVNGHKITKFDVEFFIKRGRPGHISDQKRKEALEKLIDEQLLYQEGLAKGVEKNEKLKQLLKRKEREIEELKQREVIRLLYQEHVYGQVQVGEEEARLYYNAHLGKLGRESHLFSQRFRSVLEAEAALAELRAGKSFEEMATKSFKRLIPKGRQPWDLGFLPWQRIPPEWTEAVGKLKVGEISGIVEGKTTGVRIFKLIAERKVPPPDFMKIQAVVRKRVQDAKVAAYMESFKNELREKASIVRK